MAKKTTKKRAKSLYFPHDYSAKDDQNILELRAEFGAEGYGLYWMLVESLYQNNGHLNRVAIGGLSLSYGVGKEKIRNIIDFCIDIGLFNLVNTTDIFVSDRVNLELEKRKILKINGAKGGNKRWGNDSGGIATLIPYRAEHSITEQREIYDLFPEEFKQKDFIKYLNEFLNTKSEPLSDSGVKLLIKKLFEYSVDESLAAIQDALRNGWKGVFPKSKKTTEQISHYGYDEVFGENRLPETKEIFDWVMSKSSCPAEESSVYTERTTFQDAAYRKDRSYWLNKYYANEEGLTRRVKSN